MLLTQFRDLSQKHPKWVIVFCLFFPVLFLVTLLKAAGSGQVLAAPTKPLLSTVEVIAVEHMTSYVKEVEVIGRVESGAASMLGFERAGIVIEHRADEGSIVAKGEVLSVMDTQRVQAQIKEVEAGLTRAQANARLAKLSEQRISKIVADGLDSAQSLDEARENSKAAFALVTQTQAQLQTLQVELEKSQIKAPYDGVIISRVADVGSVIAAGQPVFSIQQKHSLEVRFAMADRQAFALTLGEQTELLVGELKVNASVKSISPVRNVNTRTVDVVYQITDDVKKGTVLAGDLVLLRTPQNINESGFWIPRTALSSGIRGLWNIFTVASQQGEGEIVPKSVTVLYSNEQNAFVTGLLVESDFVVLHGGHKLVPGQLVMTKRSNSQTLVRN